MSATITPYVNGGIRVSDLTAAIRAAAKVDDVREARARVEAIKAWAKVHGKAKGLRLDLLRLEVEALVRLAELDGLDGLSAIEKKAAQHLADLTQVEREALITARGTFTTASGMCAAMWREEDLQRRLAFAQNRGRQFAAEPPAPEGTYDESAIREQRKHVHSVSAVLAELLEERTEAGEPFSITDVADQILDEAADGEPLAEDSAIRQGVRAVVREAIRRAPALTIDGTVLPRLITARTEDGKHVRIPVENATVAHLADMIAQRREQLAHDAEALRRLVEVADRLAELPGGTLPTSRIGPLIAQSLIADSA